MGNGNADKRRRGARWTPQTTDHDGPVVRDERSIPLRAESTAVRMEHAVTAIQVRKQWHIQQILNILARLKGVNRNHHARPCRASEFDGAATMHIWGDVWEEDEWEVAAARDLCLALRWHRANIASTLPVVEEEDDTTRSTELRRYIDALGRAREALVAYYDLPVLDAVDNDAYPQGAPPRICSP